MDEVVEDDFVYPAMITLVACLEQALAKRNLPPLCSIAPMIGDLVLDYCGGNGCKGGCGQAWVRLVDTFPSRDFPQPDMTHMNCAGPWAMTLEIGVVRCKPVGTNSGIAGFKPPSTEQLVKALRLQTADIRAMREAVQCCFARGDQPYQMSPYAPSTPDADCLGGIFNVIIGQD